MLYEQWRQIAASFPNETALNDLATGQTWTFNQLNSRVESIPKTDDPYVFPTGNSSDFILSILLAWRDRRIACPLEKDQSPPDLALPPKGTIHLKTTSGSTGSARTIAFNDGQLAADARNIVETMGLRQDTPNLGAISLAHSYGFSNLVLPLLLHGIPLTLAASAYPESMRLAFATGKRWTLPAVPALWQTWNKAGILGDPIRLAISAGAPLPLELECQIHASSGVKIHNFLGSSECGGIAYDQTHVPRTDPACVGTPIHGVHLSLDDRQCLQVKSQAVGMTYWPNPDPALKEGCFTTQDLVALRNGSVYILGRLSTIINVAGRKIAPGIIEEVLKRHSKVTDCLVFGIPSLHVSHSESIAVLVVAPEEIGRSLKEHARQALPEWQFPKYWKFIPALPLDSRGKSPRAELHKLIEDELKQEIPYRTEQPSDGKL